MEKAAEETIPEKEMITKKWTMWLTCDNVGIYVTSWVVKKTFIYLFIYYIPSTRFPSAEILKYRNHVRNGYDAGSEIANVSARHAALKRWTVTDKRWNNVVSRGSVVTSVKRLPICTKNSWLLTLMGPSVSNATRMSCTCSFFWQLHSQRHWHWWWHSAAESVSQSVDHCDVSSGAAPRIRWQQCQTVRPLTVLINCHWQTSEFV